MDASYLNFSWVLEGKLAGCAGPVLDGDLEFLASQGIRALVRLAGHAEGIVGRNDVLRFGIEDFPEAVSDFTAPEIDQIVRLIRFIDQCLEQVKPVAVSCGAGYGRTGTILSCYFVSRGLSAQDAIVKVREIGRKAYETQAQHQVIRDYERKVRGQVL